MHLFKTLLAVASAVAVVAAQSSLMITGVPSSIVAGDSVKITWTGGDPTAPVTLILRSGDDSNNLNTGPVITDSAVGGSFTWSVPKDIPSLSNYALQIKQGSSENYSGRFSISGGSGTALPTGSLTATLSASNSSTTTTTSSSSSSSSSESSSSTSSSTASGNLTTTATLRSTSSSAGTTRTSAPTSSSTVAPNANTAPGFASPLALVLSAMMAMIYFN